MEADTSKMKNKRFGKKLYEEKRTKKRLFKKQFKEAELRQKPLLFDANELFIEVPELIHRKRGRFVWKTIENLSIPNTYTVCKSIA